MPEKKGEKQFAITTDGFTGANDSDFQISKTIPHYQKDQTMIESQNPGNNLQLNQNLESLQLDMSEIKQYLKETNRSKSLILAL